jgi:hypothetical protein
MPIEAMKIRKLDIVAGALKRDGSHPNHGALYDSITSYVNPIKNQMKKEYQDLYDEGLRCSMLCEMRWHSDTPHHEITFRNMHDVQGI